MKFFSYLLKKSENVESVQATQKPTSTLGFRIINPELFIKPNKHVMNFGVAAIAGCVMYLVYMVATHDPKKSTKKEKTFSIRTGQVSNSTKWD